MTTVTDTEQEVSIRIRSGNTISFLNEKGERTSHLREAKKIKLSEYNTNKTHITSELRNRFGSDVHISTTER